MDERISEAVEAAQASFWQTVAEHFPEATSGDFPPGPDIAMREAMLSAVNVWVDGNVPQSTISHDNPDIQAAAQAAKASEGAVATFLRRDQCSHGGGAGEVNARYQDLLVEIHKVGDILMTKPRGTYADMDGMMLWVSPLVDSPGADLFINGHGGFKPEPDGNGSYPVAYFDELGVGVEVMDVTANLRNWLNNPVFGVMTPDYYLDQVASFVDCCRYEEFEREAQGDARLHSERPSA